MTGTQRNGWATLPNAISLLRLLLVVPIGVLLVADERPILTAVLIGVFGASDWIDGFLARRLGQVSRVGELLDPLADRIGLITIVVLLVIGGYLPAWIVLVILALDVVLVVVSLVTRSPIPPASMLGKTRTAVLMSGIVLVAIGRIPALEAVGPVGVVLCTAGAALHIVSGFGYIRSMLRHRASRKQG